MTRVLGLLLGVSLLGACQDDLVTVGKVEVDVDLGAARTLSMPFLQRTCEDGVDKHAGFVFKKDRGPALLRVEVLRAAPPRGDEPGTVRVRADVMGKDGLMYRGTGRAVGDSPTTILFARALNDALDEAHGARSMERKSIPELVGILDDDVASITQKRQAIRVLGLKKDSASVDRLIAVLDGEDRDLAEAALGALTLIADPKAVIPVIEYADSKPAYVRKRAIDAVRAMGTDEGRAWLFTLSTGHPDIEVQLAARRAFDALSSAPSSTPPVGEVAQAPWPKTRDTAAQ